MVFKWNTIGIENRGIACSVAKYYVVTFWLTHLYIDTYIHMCIHKHIYAYIHIDSRCKIYFLSWHPESFIVLSFLCANQPEQTACRFLNIPWAFFPPRIATLASWNALVPSDLHNSADSASESFLQGNYFWVLKARDNIIFL